MNNVPQDSYEGGSSGLDSSQRLKLMYGQHPAFWSNLKATSRALSICVSSSHINLAHVVGAMIVVRHTEPDVGMFLKKIQLCTVPTMTTHLQLQRRSHVNDQ